MPNILLTTVCNLSCDYCFAKERINSIPKQYMSMENVWKVISFLRESNYTNFRIMGGEPTLHPHFAEIVKIALIEGMHVDVLSNCTWSDRHNDLFSQISPHYLSFLLNINHPDNYICSTWDKIQKNLSYLKGRSGVSLSFNIFEKEPKYHYLLELAKRFSISCIRLSFSLPILDRNNNYLKLEDYKEQVPFILDFVRAGEKDGINVILDNVVPLCIFNYEQLGELVIKKVIDLNRNIRCEPIIDIGPDLSVWNCFCLSGFQNSNLDKFKNLNEVIQYYHQVIKPYQDDIFPMRECYDCQYRTNWGCQGGCITFSIDQEVNKRLYDRSNNTQWNDKTCMVLGNDVNVIKYNFPAESIVLRNLLNRTQIELNSQFGQFINLLDGQHTAGEILKSILANDKNDHDNDPFNKFELDIKIESIKNILLGLANAKLIEFRN